jgi:hypothetical protein
MARCRALAPGPRQGRPAANAPGLVGSIGDTFHQDGRCVYADDRVSISLIHETGTAPSGDRFDNLAVYVGRLPPAGTAERLWTVDPDAEHCEASWKKNPATPSKAFS